MQRALDNGVEGYLKHFLTIGGNVTVGAAFNRIDKTSREKQLSPILGIVTARFFGGIDAETI